MFNSGSVNIFNCNCASKICFLNFLPCLILLWPQLNAVRTSGYRGFNCFKKTILRVSALKKSFWLRLGCLTAPHKVILVPAKCSAPTTRFCAGVTLQMLWLTPWQWCCLKCQVTWQWLGQRSSLELLFCSSSCCSLASFYYPNVLP